MASKMDIALIFLLILLNGVFAMSEIAIVSSRKSRLQNLADDGSLGAKAALSLHQQPASFFSTIQVGITSVGILSGAIGEAAVADPLAAWLSGIPLLAPYAKTSGPIWPTNEEARNLWNLCRIKAGFGPFLSTRAAVKAALSSFVLRLARSPRNCNVARRIDP